MSEVFLPPWIQPEQESHEWLDEGSSVFAASFAPGLAQRQSYGGLRLKLSRRHTVRAEEKAYLLAALANTRGRYNALRTKVHVLSRGSGMGSELLSNNTFPNGTTGWTSGSQYTLSASGRVLRAQRNATTAPDIALRPSSTIAVTQYAPLVQRFFVSAGRGGHTAFALRAGSTATGTDYLDDAAVTGPGLLSKAFVPHSTTAGIGLVDAAGQGLTADDFFLVPFTSLVRAALVDNRPNLILQSDTIDNGSWSSTGLGSVTANAVAAPDGTTTAELLNQDTSSGGHFRYQNYSVSSSIQTIAASCCFRASNRTWAFLLLEEQTAGQSCQAFFNLSTGAIGTVTSATNMANARAYIVAKGNGWFECHLVARKTNAATTVQLRLCASTGDNTLTYTGSAEGAIYVWRAGAAVSGTPFNPGVTTSSLSTGTAQTGGGISLKGLPASTSGVLLPGDFVEINGELKQVTVALDADAAGLGYLQFEPALIRSPANDDPVILTDPMGKFLVSNIKVDNEFGVQARVSYDLEHIYE